MAKSKKPVAGFISAKNNVLDFFGCDGDFYIKPLLEYEWSVKSNDELCILSYKKADEAAVSAVVVKKNGEPMIYSAGGYTMVIAIDCIKTAFVFKNS